ncbi:hypothetical protein [Nitrospira sp. M1]
MRMQEVLNTRLRICSLSCAMLIMLCGSLGFLCPMMLPMADASSLPHHEMDGTEACIDSLLLTLAQNQHEPIHSIALETPTPWGSLALHRNIIDTTITQHPPRSGPLRYIFLSTLLI